MTLHSAASRRDLSITELEQWAVAQEASTWVVDLEPYTSCQVVGLVEGLRIDPRGGHIEARVTDGTADILARWFIRRPTPQLTLAPGRGVILRGIVLVGDDGGLVLNEPEFELIP